MRRFLVATMVLAALLAGCGDDGRDGGDAAAENRCDRATDDVLRAWERAGFSGSVSIAEGGRFRCDAAYGLADEGARTPNTVDTVFSIGSVSKAFTAAAIFKLADAGRLSLSDRAGELVPSLRGPAADATVEQLLLHTSGLAGSHGDDHDPLSREAAIDAIGGLRRIFEPGSDFDYSNAGYSLLALIVEARSGTTYREYMATQVLALGDNRIGGFWDGDPKAAGPRAVGYLEDGPTDEMGDFAGPHWAVDGNGDLAMTTNELARWVHGLFTGAVIPREAVRLLEETEFEQGGGVAEIPGWVTSDGKAVGTRFYSTAGGGGDVGHNAVVAWIPEGQRVVAIASNTPDVSAEDLLDTIGPALVTGKPLPLPRTSARPAGDLSRFTGTYELSGGGAFDVRVREDRLAVAARGRAAIAALFPRPAGYSANDVATHERAVLVHLDPGAEEGRNIRASLAAEFGQLGEAALAGTVVKEGELRAYVTLPSRRGEVIAWYALDEKGGVAAVEVPAQPPTLTLVPSGGSRFVPDDPTGKGPELTATFNGSRMVVATATGRTTATR